MGQVRPIMRAADTRRPVECANCGWKGKRMTGKTHDCPKCGAWVTFTGED